jgi:lipoprotein-releasing system ATP-binding protein
MEKLKLMGMDAYAKKPSGKLSGGQQQRVAIARALINDPAIIMADEPTGNLDSGNSEIVFEIFRSLSKKGNTIITVTHDNDFAKGADRILEIVDGKIQF